MARKPRTQGADLALRQALDMIQRDIATEKAVFEGRESRWNKLENKTADKLIQYVKFLENSLREKEKAKKVKEKEYSKMTNDELIALLTGDQPEKKEK